MRSIDYFTLKDSDYYILFLACYLHDISMVVHPSLDNFKINSPESDKIFTDFYLELNRLQKNAHSMGNLKHMLLDYFKKIFSHFENNVRNNHPKQSALFVKNSNDKYLSFIENSILQIVADVSEAHGYDTHEVYGRKSEATSDLSSIKYLMILLRLADLFDMSKDRVSYYILKENIKHMGAISQFHWISHLITEKCEIETKYNLRNIARLKNESYLSDGSLSEEININIHLNTKQLTTILPAKCKGVTANLNLNENKIEISILDDKKLQCNRVGGCLFVCKWISQKHEYLFSELYALKEYLNRIDNGLFKTSINVNIYCSNKINFDPEFMDIIQNHLN